LIFDILYLIFLSRPLTSLFQRPQRFCPSTLLVSLCKAEALPYIFYFVGQTFRFAKYYFLIKVQIGVFKEVIQKVIGFRG